MVGLAALFFSLLQPPRHFDTLLRIDGEPVSEEELRLFLPDGETGEDACLRALSRVKEFKMQFILLKERGVLNNIDFSSLMGAYGYTGPSRYQGYETIRAETWPSLTASQLAVTPPTQDELERCYARYVGLFCGDEALHYLCQPDGQEPYTDTVLRSQSAEADNARLWSVLSVLQTGQRAVKLGNSQLTLLSRDYLELPELDDVRDAVARRWAEEQVSRLLYDRIQNAEVEVDEAAWQDLLRRLG